MNKFLTSSALILLLAIHALSHRVTPYAPQRPPVEDENAVYAAVIERVFDNDRRYKYHAPGPLALLVIKAETALDSMGDRIAAEHIAMGLNDSIRHWRSTLPQEAVEDYRIKNREPRRLSDALKLQFKHVLVERDELEQYRKAKRWDKFYEKYPDSNGFLSFSRVGFDSGKSQAVVYLEHWCDELCGYSYYLVLSKDKEGWKVTKLDTGWIS
jgi:hypothetical protein